jgi:hypothetical protein
MGEAKLRAEALAYGQPWPEDFHRCPNCRGRRTAVESGPPMGLSHVPTLYGVCADCEALWEAYPADWQHDAVDAPPCDNCAFAKGSPESGDREAWLSTLAKLRMGTEFKCHKGAPILIDKGASTVEFDEVWVRRHGRTCAGFLKAMQQWPGWLERRYSVAHVLTNHDADRLEGIEPIVERRP